jgi:hypothetical protein
MTSVFDKAVHGKNIARVIESNDSLIVFRFSILTRVLDISEHIKFLLFTQMSITDLIGFPYVLKLDVKLVDSGDGEDSAHDNLIEVIVPDHVWVVQKDLLHCVEGDLGDCLLLFFGLEDVLAQLDDLEGDLMEDSSTQFLINSLDFFCGEFLVHEEILNISQILRISPYFLRYHIHLYIQQMHLNIHRH